MADENTAGDQSKSAESLGKNSLEVPTGGKRMEDFMHKGEQLLQSLMTQVASMSQQSKKMAEREKTMLQRLKRKYTDEEGEGSSDAKKRKKESEDTADGKDQASNSCRTDTNTLVDGFLEGDDDTESEDNCETEDDILDELGQFFEKKSDTSEKTSENLARVANEGLRSYFNGEKLKQLEEKYLRPENIENLQIPTIDPNLWRQLPRDIKVRDVMSQQQISKLNMVLVPIIRVLDSLKEKDSKIAHSKTKEHIASAFKLTCMYINEIQTTRKERIKKELLQKYKNLCEATTTATKLLGKDLKEEIKQRTDKDQPLTKSYQPGNPFLGRKVGRGNIGPPYNKTKHPRQHPKNPRPHFKKGPWHKNPGFRK